MLNLVIDVVIVVTFVLTLLNWRDISVLKGKGRKS
jgi:hypothetical protein